MTRRERVSHIRLGDFMSHDAAACRVPIRRCDLCYGKGYRWWKGGKPRPHPVIAGLVGSSVGTSVGVGLAWWLAARG